ncbi:hypothetical protein DZF91_04390, partial [Actinomadura logoneensis]
MGTTTRTRTETADPPRSTAMKAAVRRMAARAVEKKTTQPADDSEQPGQDETPSPVGLAGHQGRRLLVRYRRQLAPLAALGATHAAGAAASAADGPAALGVLALTGAGTV